MSDPRSDRSHQDPDSGDGSNPDPQPDDGYLDDMQAMIDEIRAIAMRLLGDLSSLALAQWHLTRYVLLASATVGVIRVRTTLMIYGLVICSWIFLNVAIWCIMMDLADYNAAPPLALVVLNTLTAVGLKIWRKTVILR
ncbi:MAG: hypothetical protein JJU11_08335 [Candidatus Sumerlaeia bacterium]|nr:hypothetical protein [Candidatus Sumerlaeia bacterium]